MVRGLSSPLQIPRSATVAHCAVFCDAAESDRATALRTASGQVTGSSCSTATDVVVAVAVVVAVVVVVVVWWPEWTWSAPAVNVDERQDSETTLRRSSVG